jgi:uncharacterized protein
MATVYEAPGVYIQEVDRGSAPIQGVSTAVAAFVGFTAQAPGDDPDDPAGLRPRLVTNWSQFERLYGGFAPGALLPHAVYGYFGNGGGRAYVVRVPRGDGDGSDEQRPARAELPAAADQGPVLRIEAVEAGADLRVLVEGPSAAERRRSEPDDETGSEPTGAAGPPTFTLKVRQGERDVESFPDLTIGAGDRNVAQVVNAESTRIRVEQLLDEPSAVPATGSFPLRQPAVVPDDVSAGSFEGTEADRRGIRGLVIAEDVTMLAVPDLATVAVRDGELDLELWRAVQQAMIDHCEQVRTRLAILDAPPGMAPQRLAEWRRNEAMYDSPFAAMYWPYLRVRNPDATGDGDQLVEVPACGHVAGVWARNDSTRGVHKAPANEIVRGALDVSTKVTDGEQELLNPNGINCIRPFGVRGIRIWGARTLSSDVNWRYVNVRRLFNFVEESVRRNTGWVVFEPNDQALWQRVKRSLNGFLYELWLGGALLGATPDRAYFVKCDEENNPPSQVEKGMLTVDVGLAALRPAEFVVFRFSQFRDESTPA